MNNPRSKEEAASLAATLQNAAEPLETRRIALDALLSASRQETACSALCSAGAVHSAFVAIKASQGEPPVLIESALSLLSNLSKFDSKLVSVVARLQGGIVALLEAIREQLSMASSDLADRALQHALLRSLSDVTHSLQNAQLVAKENGITVILGCVLSHLKDESIVLPALQVLVSVSRHLPHVSLLVREGAVPAILAALLAHVQRTHVVKAGLTIMKNIVADENVVSRFSGQGAYRILLTVMQAHNSHEHIELVRLASTVLWRMQHARNPPDSWLHSYLRFDEATSPAANAPLPPDSFSFNAEASRSGSLPQNASTLSSSSSEEDDDSSANPKDPADVAVLSDTPPLPAKGFVMDGHVDFIDMPPATPEPLGTLPAGLTYPDLVARAITAEAEALVASAAAETTSPEEGAFQMGSGRTSDDVNGAVAQLGWSRFPRVVFDSHPADGCSPHSGALESSLRFDADFESANLRRVIQTGPTSYSLVLACDVNTRGHTQWFLFRVANAQAGIAYRLSIVNMMKPDSLFAKGMRPLLYSEAQAARKRAGWRRCGEHICYFANQYSYAAPLKRKGSKGNKGNKGGGDGVTNDASNLQPFYTLMMTIRFPEDDDVCYLAQCYPFTHSMLRRYLDEVDAKVSLQGQILHRETLCWTSGGHPCDLLTVTDFSASAAEISARRVVVISARVHPGETNASWMMNGLIDAVTAATPEAIALRAAVVMRIVPMLNPDGVILGNYRCGIAGVDLNRQWQEPYEEDMPTIFHLKRLLKSYDGTDQLLLFCDLHGHSRKSNAFTYGCDGAAKSHAARIFPRLLADCPHFSLQDCSYKVLRSKENTGRVVVWRQMNLAHSYTLEASFCGADFGPGAGNHFSTKELRELGAAFVPALLALVEPAQTRVSAICAELEAQAAMGATLGGSDDDQDADTGTNIPSKGRRAGKAPTASRLKAKGGTGASGAGSSGGGGAAGTRPVGTRRRSRTNTATLSSSLQSRSTPRRP